MSPWTCPACERRFGSRNQSHECAPALSLDEYFSTGPAREKPIFEAVRAHLEALGPVHVEPVSVGIFFKRSRTFVELRTMRDWVALWFRLGRPVDHPRVTRKVQTTGRRTWYIVRLRGPEDVDDEVRGWLSEAYLESPV